MEEERLEEEDSVERSEWIRSATWILAGQDREDGGDMGRGERELSKRG